MAVEAERPGPRRLPCRRAAVLLSCVLFVPWLAACGQNDQPQPSPGIGVPASPGDGEAPSPSGPAPSAPSPSEPAPSKPAPSESARTEPASPEPAPTEDQKGVAMDAELSIMLTSADSTARFEQLLVCRDSRPAEGSTVIDPEGACAALAKHGDKVFFELPDPNRLCTQQYGGPQQAHVTGTFNGREVNKHFSLTDGCKISEWNAMAALLGSRAGEV